MALQLWLPFNRTYKNYGLDASIKISSINSSYVKLKDDDYSPIGGKSLDAHSTEYGFRLNSKLGNNIISEATEYSVSTFVYYSGMSKDYIFVCGPGAIRCGLANNGIYLRTDANPNTTSKVITFPQKTANTWTHYAFTFKDGKIKAYVNGEYYAGVTKGTKMVSGITTGSVAGLATAYTFDGKISDFRIYDNALTDEDIKRIYKQKLFELVPYSGAKDVLFDRSGLMNMPVVNQNADFQNNALYFNGSSKLRPKDGNVGFTMDDGTLSVWFTIETSSTSYQIIYIDSVSKFAIGYVKSSERFYTTCNSTNVKGFSSNLVKFDGSINNIIVSYNTGKTPSFMLVNGIEATDSGNSNFTEKSGLTIGNRMYSSAQSGFKGKLLKVGVYNRQFTQDEAVELYNSEREMFLPDDYIQLEYIEGSGTQWIDSGVKANQDTVVEIEFEITGNATGYGAIFGARTNSSSDCFDAWTRCGNGNIGIKIGDSGSKNCNISQALNVVYKLKASNGNITVNGDSVNFTPVSDFETPLNVRIFNIANGNTSSSGTANRILIGKVYSFKLYKSNIIIRNMIPSKHKSDNIIGMYDMVTKQFFTNSGTGSFTGA